MKKLKIKLTNHFKGNKCKIIKVSEKCCYIKFGKSKYDSSLNDLTTVRKELIVIDFDKKGFVIGIELVNPDLKSCQRD